MVYDYPEPDFLATAKFVILHFLTSNGRACLAIIYDAECCNQEVVCDAILKSMTQSVVRVDPEIIPSI